MMIFGYLLFSTTALCLGLNNCYFGNPKGPDTHTDNHVVVNDMVSNPIPSYTEALVVLFLVVIFRAISGSGVYTKVKYLLVLLVGLGSVFLEINLNFIIPIFYSLEFGTALFIVVVIKSFVGLWNEQGTIVWYGTPTLIISLIFAVLIGSFFSKTSGGLVFTDFFRSSLNDNEFISFVLSMIQQQPDILLATLFYILAATGVIITGRQTLLAPGKLEHSPTRGSIFQKVKEVAFDLHKNLIHPFTPN